jgi:hypothetical protein
MKDCEAGIHDSFLGRIWRPIALLLLAAVVYAPSLNGPFFWDDDELLYQNPDVIHPGGILHVWVNNRSSDYTPLATASYWIEWGFWKRWTLGYHAVNVLLHGFAACLLWLVLRHLGLPGAFLAALMFDAHPVCVESVAWISERRNTLSMCFYLGSILAFLNYLETETPKHYRLALGLYAAALLCKGSVVVQPLVLLLVVWWLGRGRIVREDFSRIVPFGGLALAMGVVTIWFQHHRAMGSIDSSGLTFARRLTVASQAVWFYLAKAWFPFQLNLIYPALPALPFRAELLALPAVAGAWLILFRARAGWGRSLLFAFSYFVLALLPALGLIKMAYSQHAPVADHFQYLALIGPVALTAAGIQKLGRFRFAGGPVAVLVLACFTLTRSWYFGHPNELWQLTARDNPEAWTAHEHIGIARYEAGDLVSAERAFELSVKVRPPNYRAWFNLGVIRAQRGDCRDATGAFHRAAMLRPEFQEARKRAQACEKSSSVPH